MIFGLAFAPRVSQVPKAQGSGGPGRKTRSCRRFWSLLGREEERRKGKETRGEERRKRDSGERRGERGERREGGDRGERGEGSGERGEGRVKILHEMKIVTT